MTINERLDRLGVAAGVCQEIGPKERHGNL